MKLKPILFSTPMVQAILAGRKTMTRRIVKPQPDERGLRSLSYPFENWHGQEVKPKYNAGDIIWVRETWLKDERGGGDGFYYKADLPDPSVWKGYWKPSIFMPKDAARIFLKVTNVRVERLNDISEEDAIAEGVKELVTGHSWVDYFPQQISYNLGMKKHTMGENDYGCGTAKQSFQSLWQSINGKDSWDKNPWVWVYEFERVNQI